MARPARTSGTGRSSRARDDRRQLLERVVETVVDDHVAELGLCGELLLGDLAGGARPPAASSVPRPISRVRSAASDGGAMNTCTASGIAARTWRAPWTSISSTTGTPARTRSSSSERSVP